MILKWHERLDSFKWVLCHFSYLLLPSIWPKIGHNYIKLVSLKGSHLKIGIIKIIIGLQINYFDFSSGYSSCRCFVSFLSPIDKLDYVIEMSLQTFELCTQLWKQRVKCALLSYFVVLLIFSKVNGGDSMKGMQFIWVCSRNETHVSNMVDLFPFWRF